MKVLHVFHHSNLVNGVDRTTLTLLRALRRLGTDVIALVPEVGDVTAALDESGVTYRVSRLGCCTGPAKMAELTYLGLAASRAQEIESWIREEKVDLVHINTGHLLDAAIAATRTETAAVWHIHAPFDEDYRRYAGFMQPEAYAWMLEELGSHVVAVSDDVRDSLLTRLPDSRVTTLHNGIDIDDLELRAGRSTESFKEALGLTIETPVVLGVGRISAQKDFATFVRVAHRVSAIHPKACFAIAGPEENKALADGLRRQIDELGLSKRVFLLGPRDDAPALMVQSDVFLSTALFEGHPLTSLEAMSFRKPVVAMDCVGLRECINDGVDGLLVPLGNVDACASAVLRVLGDKGLASRLGTKGRERVETRYSAEAYAQGFLRLARLAQSGGRNARSAAAASFALGLLNEIRDARERLVTATSARRSLSARLQRSLRGLLGMKREQKS